MEELSSEPPTDINPYHVLSVPKDATSNDVKSAYKKLALKHHPDKAAHSEKDNAHIKFQEIAFAYAILSSPSRRARYDNTGSTSDSLDLDDDDFNWSDFFRQQWAEAITSQKLDDFKSEYQHSAEEERDVLIAYDSANGNLNRVFQEVMLSNPLDDETRFRGYIDAAISEGKVKPHHAYVHEAAHAREKRRRGALKEAKQAEAYAKEIGVHDKLFGGKTKKTKNQSGVDEAGLAELVQQRAKSRANTFLQDLEAKYVGKGTGKKRQAEPSEAAFQETAKRMKKKKVEAVIEEEEDVDLEVESAEEDTMEDDDEKEEQEEVEEVKENIPLPKRKKKAAPKKQTAPKKQPPKRSTKTKAVK